MLLAFIFPRCMYLADFGISKSTEDASKLQELGILAGQIPTAIKTGGTQRMLRRHIVWRIFWILAILLCTTAVVATYLNIGKQRAGVFVTWAGFVLARAPICFLPF